MGAGQWGGAVKHHRHLINPCQPVWKWSHLIHLMGNVRGKFLSSIPLTLLVHAHTALLTTGNPALNYHSSQSSSCFSDHFRLDYFGLVLPHAGGLDLTKSWDCLWCSIISASPVRAQGTALVCHCSSNESIFNCLDPIHKHTLSAGNEAEHYVMHIQELKQSLGVSSNFLLSLFRLPQPSPAQSVTAALHQCNLLK